MMTLYVADPASVATIQCSPPSWICLMAMAEKGVAHETVRLDFSRGEHRTAEMLAKNPRGTIPLLEHDGVVVHETLAIVQYVESWCPGPALAPKTRAPAARALTRLHESSTLKDRGMALFAHLMRQGDGDRGAELARAFETELDRWEGYYQADDFVAGELGLADLVVLAYVATARRLGLDLESRPALTRFFDRMRARPSVVQTWPEAWSGPITSSYPR